MFTLLRKYYNKENTERKILNLTIFWLFYAFILVRLVPFKWFSKLLGEFKKTDNFELTGDQLLEIKKIIKNLQSVKKRLPWKVKCLEEAITAKKILNRYKIRSTVYMGVMRGGNKNLIAHAWLKSGDHFITGEKGHQRFGIVGYYC